jgi:Zn-dependent protease with chaperone function
MFEGFAGWWRRHLAAREGQESSARRVQRIFARLLAATDLASARRVALVRSRRPNAFSLSDGTVLVSTGLLDLLRLSDDELAFVIGHEIAHSLLGHGRKHSGRTLLLGAGTMLSTLLFGQRAAEWAFLLGHLLSMRASRQEEKDADRLGMYLAARAGFDPKGALTLWRKASKLGNGSIIPWFADHPSGVARLAHLRASLETAGMSASLGVSVPRVALGSEKSV